MSENNPKILISYTHDSPEHKNLVLRLSNRLRDDGLDCHIDQYENSPAEGWARWMVNQIEQADFILVVCTETYNRRFRGKEESNKGLGAQWEGFVITQEMYEHPATNTKFIPIIFSSENAKFIPGILRSATYYRADVEEGYDDIYRRLTQQPRIIKPPLGKRRILSPFETLLQTRQDVVEENTDTEKNKNNSGANKQSFETAQANKHTNLVLLYLAENKYIFVPSKRIETGEELILQLLPENSRQTAFLADLQGQRQRQNFGVVFGNTALQVQLKKANSVHEGTDGYWQLILKVSEERFGGSALSDYTFNDYSPEDIAELRARRILLNEQLEIRRGRDKLTDGMVESMISRGDGIIETIHSPLPILHQQFQNDISHFLAAARLMCILYLQLTGTVEHIFTLDLKMESETKVLVQFDGQRSPRYSNAEPFVIKFEGVCNLV
jgi:SEFIR domain